MIRILAMERSKNEIRPIIHPSLQDKEISRENSNVRNDSRRAAYCEQHFRIADYPSIIQDEESRPDSIALRLVIRDIPRRFHQLTYALQHKALADRPELTHTPWDALLAAVTEHIAMLHDHPVPTWCEERERFLAPPQFFLPIPTTRLRVQALLDAPGAFIRHGALIDPRELDSRGGERFAWCAPR